MSEFDYECNEEILISERVNESYSSELSGDESELGNEDVPHSENFVK